MHDESAAITDRTWSRNVDSINKIGYMDGASDGQKSSFQSSFNSGYMQGLDFGFNLGFHNASLSFQEEHSGGVILLRDSREINCNICIDSSTLQQNVVNLYNTQKEKNDEITKELKIK